MVLFSKPRRSIGRAALALVLTAPGAVAQESAEEGLGEEPGEGGVAAGPDEAADPEVETAPDPIETAPEPVETAPEPVETAPESPPPDESDSEPAGDLADYYGEPEPFLPSFSESEAAAPLPEPPYMGPFRAGQIQLGLSIGYQASTDQSWFVPGVSVGYFLVNGLLAHVDTDFWIGDPFVATPSPGLKFVFFMLPVVNPYVGAFYRHYFVGGGYEDADSVGARGGIYILTGPRSYFGGGVVYERILEDDLFVDQNLIYPEIAFVFSF